MIYIQNVSDVKCSIDNGNLNIRRLKTKERIPKCIIPTLVFVAALWVAINNENIRFFVMPIVVFLITLLLLYLFFKSGEILFSFNENSVFDHSGKINDVCKLWEYEIHQSGLRYYRCYYGVEVLNGRSIALVELRAQSIPRSSVWRDFAKGAGLNFEYLKYPPDCLSGLV